MKTKLSFITITTVIITATAFASFIFKPAKKAEEWRTNVVDPGSKSFKYETIAAANETPSFTWTLDTTYPGMFRISFTNIDTRIASQVAFAVDAEPADSAYKAFENTSFFSNTNAGSHLLYLKVKFRNGAVSASSSKSFTVTDPARPGVFIATNGNDTNSGLFAAAPVRTFSNALYLAAANSITNVFVGEGLYKTNAGLNPTGFAAGVCITNNFMQLLGGWNSNFTTNTNYSILDMKRGGRVLYAENVRGIRIDRFLITGGGDNILNNIIYGAGIYFNNVSDSIICSNVIVSNNAAYTNNYSQVFGGGVHVGYGSNNTINGIIVDNSANGGDPLIYGGGISIYNSKGNKITAYLSNNWSAFYGSALSIYNSEGTEFTGTAVSNTNQNNGYCIDIRSESGYPCRSNIIGGVIARTAGAGGIYISNASYNIISGIVISNRFGVTIDNGSFGSGNTIASNSLIAWNKTNGLTFLFGNYSYVYGTIMSNQGNGIAIATNTEYLYINNVTFGNSYYGLYTNVNQGNLGLEYTNCTNTWTGNVSGNVGP